MHFGSESEICYNDRAEIILLSKEDVFWFEISMHHISGVHVGNTFTKSAHDLASFIDGEFVFGLDFILELTSFKKIEDEVEGVFRFVDFM